MYRALTWLALREGTPLDDGEALAALAREYPVTFGDDARVEIAGSDVTDAIREADIDRLVPEVARHPAVREVMRERQRTLGATTDAVIEGRDIGTVVAPQAEVKVFLVADEAERARRRGADRPGVGADTLAADLRARDERDAVNTRPAPDAHVLDTTDLSIEDVVSRIEGLVSGVRA
jgi:cytidylate kinase